MSSIVVDTFTSIVEEVNSAYTSAEIYSIYGHKKEINRRLLEKNQDSVYKYQKYPLIALNMPFSEDVSFDNISSLSLNIAIMNYTEKTYNSDERYEQVFKAVLEPLYELFLQNVEEHPDVMTLATPEHRRIDRLFWGDDQQEKQTFTDPLDAIELVNFEIKILNNKC